MMSSRLRSLALVVPLGFALACGGTPFAAAAQNPNASGLQTPDYRIQTDETHWNFNTGDFTMPHRVRFSRPGTDAVSDKATGNSKNGTATLVGSVVVHDSGNASEASDAAYHGSGPATLLCDQLEIDSKAKLYTATGHVHFSQGSRSGTADKAILNRANGTLHLEGSVHLTDNGSTITTDVLDYNLNTKDVDVRGNPTIMTQPANKAAPPPSSPPRGRQTAKPKPKPSPSPKRKP
jgi:lipopolysaccharide export system protein LptA